MSALPKRGGGRQLLAPRRTADRLVGLPAELAPLLRQRAFWRRFYWDLEETFVISCRAANDPDEAIRIIRAVLRENGAPLGTRLRQTTREEREIPLPEF